MTPLNATHQRQIRRKGEEIIQEALESERRRSGIHGFEALAEGALRQIALELSLRVSPDAATQFFRESFVRGVLAEVADRLGAATSAVPGREIIS